MTYDSLPVGDALSRHYAAHGLPADGGEASTWFHVRIGPLTIPLPNPPARRRAVFFHDVNHVLTGYNTTFSDGEMVIAGFELGNGCGGFWIAWLINIAMFTFGLFVRPRDVFRAFVRGRRASSVYRRADDRVVMNAMTVGALRNSTRLDASPATATAGDWLQFSAWAIAGVILVLSPVIALILATRARGEIRV